MRSRCSREPDIVILEGLNVLQTGVSAGADARFVSDWFDFSIYVDADEADIEQWYVDRFFALRETAFNDETSFFRHFAAMSDDELERDGSQHLGDHQRPQPAREHPPEPHARRPGAGEGGRPRCAPRPVAAASS